MNTEVLEADTMTVAADQAAMPLVAGIQSGALQSQPAALGTPAHLLAVAVQRGASIEELRELMALEREWRADMAEQAMNADFAGFKAEAVEIIKRKRVHFTSQKGVTDYKHAELSDVIDAVTPALSRHGLSASWAMRQEKDWLWVTCTLRHRAGHSMSVELGGPYDNSGNKNPVQAITSTKTMLERQTLKAILGVAEKGEDDDGRGGPDAKKPAAAGAQDETNALRAAGQAEAAKGTSALNKWWGSLNGKQRNLMNGDFGLMRREARDADAKTGGTQ